MLTFIKYVYSLLMIECWYNATEPFFRCSVNCSVQAETIVILWCGQIKIRTYKGSIPMRSFGQEMFLKQSCCFRDLFYQN